MTIFSEDSRVKIPCILHLRRLGYQYLSIKGKIWDKDTNIFPDLFRVSIAKINPGIEADDINRLFEEVKLSLDNEDLGKAFYEKLTDRSNTRLIEASDRAIAWRYASSWKIRQRLASAVRRRSCIAMSWM